MAKWYYSDGNEFVDNGKCAELSFVKFVQFTGKTNASGSLLPKKVESKTDATNYGSAAFQINQLNGAVLHNNGYRGQGMVIAVIDAGFYNVNNNIGFDSLRNGRLLGTKDFANSSSLSNVYNEDSHALTTYVLSTMAGNIPNNYRC